MEEGKARHLGLSEVSVAEAEAAHAEHPVTAIQSELSLWSQQARDPQSPSGDVVGWCAQHGASFVPFAPLGRGFLSGTITSVSQLEESDFRHSNARYQDDAITENLRIVDIIRQVAQRHGATPAQVAIAWTMALGDHVIPIPGTKREKYLVENFRSGDLELTSDDMELLAAVPAAVGTRYGEGKRF